jgi:hypothetical protein
VYCATHPQTDAVRDCARCGALHCVDCVRWVGNERKAIAACTRCDGVLRPLNVQVVAPAPAEARASLERLLTPTGFVTVGAIAAIGGMSDIPVPLVDLLIGLVAQLALAATWFNLVDHVGSGKPGFPAPVEAAGWPFGTLVVRGLLCVLVVCTPFGIWLGFDRGAEGVGELLAKHPFAAAGLGLFTLAWLTAAVLAMLVTTSGLAAFWPPALVRVVALDARRYLRLLALILGSTAAIALVRVVLGLAGRVPFLSTLVVSAVTAMALFAQATLVGAFVHRNRELYTTR